ncbi:MAG: hypothetical protein IKJ45_00130, partial [Kiritimatiellae bacterium]|nr:hypothetical protein [Kiritimatiellia bacterium]
VYHNLLSAVKYGTRWQSAEKFCRKFGSYVDEPVVFHPLDVKTDKGILYLPLYMTGLINRF